MWCHPGSVIVFGIRYLDLICNSPPLSTSGHFLKPAHQPSPDELRSFLSPSFAVLFAVLCLDYGSLSFQVSACTICFVYCLHPLGLRLKVTFSGKPLPTCIPYMSLSTLSCFAWLIVHPGQIDHELWGGRNSVPAFLSVSLLPNAWHLEGVCELRGREGACLPQGTLAPSSRWIIGVFHYIEGWMFHSPLWGQRAPLRSSFPEARYTSNDYQVLLEVLSLPSSRQDPLWTVKQLILLQCTKCI